MRNLMEHRAFIRETCLSKRRTTLRPAARKAAIFDVVERRGRASVEQLAEKFDTSLETVRKDLSALADAGRVRKVHGGAVRIAHNREAAFHERMSKNTLAKQLIAEKLVKTISPGQSLFIDTGSTTLVCAETLARIRGLTVITNSARIAEAISGKNNGSNAILLGGSYRHDNAQTVGPTTLSQIGLYQTDHAVLTVGTLDKTGIADFSEEEAQIARAMMEATRLVTIVADRTKLNKQSTYRLGSLQQIDRLILDKSPDTDLHETLVSANVEVL